MKSVYKLVTMKMKFVDFLPRKVRAYQLLEAQRLVN